MSLFSKSTSIILILAGLIGLYRSDAKDTEEAYRENVAKVGYENTIETAIPQTELYDMILEHFNSELPEGKTEKKAIVIGYDGCRADSLTLTENSMSGVRKMLEAGASCNIGYCGGVNYPETNTQATSTAPGWCSVLTGEWADKTGVTANSITKSLEYKTLLTSLVEDGVIDSSDFITRWKGHFINDDSTYLLEKEYCEEKGLNVGFSYCIGTVACATETINDIKSEDCPDFIFAIYEGTDSAGHSFGFSLNDPIYQIGYRLNDILAYRTLCAIENRDTYDTEDWLIIITSDHGGYGVEHGSDSIQERMIFIISNK